MLATTPIVAFIPTRDAARARAFYEGTPGLEFKRYGFPGQNEAGIWAAPDGSKVAWFADPDGNTLSLSQHAHA